MALAASALAAPAAGYGGVEAYPTFVEKAAVLTWHLIRNHPMPDGNKRTGSSAFSSFERNSRGWRIHPAEEEDETVALFEGVAAGTVTRHELQKWLESHLEPSP